MLWVWASSCLHLISAVGVILLLLLSTFKPLDSTEDQTCSLEIVDPFFVWVWTSGEKMELNSFGPS